MGVLETPYLECFLRLWGFWRRFIWSVLSGYGGFGDNALYRVFLGYGGFGNALYRVFYWVIGVLMTLYIECFIRLLGFWRRFI